MVSRTFIIAELAERSPIIIQLAVTHQAEKIWLYDRTTVQGAIFNMRGQLYHKHANATALFNSPVVSALGSEVEPGQGVVPVRCAGKKNEAPLLGLAKSIY